MEDKKVILAKHERFETERLLLRRVTITDAAAIFDYASRAEVADHAGFKRAETLTDTELDLVTWFEANRLSTWGLVDKTTARVIGSIGFQLSDDKANFGWSLHPDFWGQGLATEAALLLRDFCFQTLGLSVVEATHFAGNWRSARVMEKLGMKKMGQIYLTLQGKSQLADYYALTKEEFLDLEGNND